jgi:CHASE3 domain sensor protein|tara:strand:- start:775 stop:1032 length:258 start_codon:yes stop_codon:yes gene_type:complete
MAGYVNSRVDLELDGDDIMAAIMDDVTDAARQTVHEEASAIIESCHDEIRDIVRDVMTEDMDIDDEIASAVNRELANYEIVFVRK